MMPAEIRRSCGHCSIQSQRTAVNIEPRERWEETGLQTHLWRPLQGLSHFRQDSKRICVKAVVVAPRKAARGGLGGEWWQRERNIEGTLVMLGRLAFMSQHWASRQSLPIPNPILTPLLSSPLALCIQQTPRISLTLSRRLSLKRTGPLALHTERPRQW